MLTASRFFTLPVSTKRHIFLASESGIGKTYLIQNILQSLRKTHSIGGFTTFFDIHSDKEKILYISAVRAEGIAQEKEIVMHWTSGSIRVYEEIFETFGAQLLQQSQDKDLIIMDELGRFEENCVMFKREVFRCLDCSIPILGVIRNLQHPSWLDELKKHPNVTVLYIDKNNIDGIKKELCHKFLYK